MRAQEIIQPTRGIDKQMRIRIESNISTSVKKQTAKRNKCKRKTTQNSQNKQKTTITTKTRKQ
jgi:hypothetical protein